MGEDAATRGLSAAFVELEAFVDCDEAVFDALEGKELDPDASLFDIFVAGVATFFGSAAAGDDTG